MTKEDSYKTEMLYRLYEQPMYRIAYAVLNDSGSAEDAVSEAFMRIIRRINKIGEPDSEDTRRYIIKTIKNTAIDQYRKNRIHYARVQNIEEEHALIPDDSADVESIVSDNESSELIKNLNETDRNIITLRFFKQMSWKDVAKNLSLTESNVRKRFERARKSIVLMKGELYDEKK